MVNDKAVFLVPQEMSNVWIHASTVTDYTASCHSQDTANPTISNLRIEKVLILTSLWVDEAFVFQDVVHASKCSQCD